MNARDNPFGSGRVLTAIRYTDPAAHDSQPELVDALVRRLSALGWRAAIVGPHGSGKTTLLEDLGDVLTRRGWRLVHVRLDTDGPRLPPRWRETASQLGAGDVVCLDGAEQLGALAWLRFRWQTRRAGGLLVTTHRPGRLATLTACTTNPGLLGRIIERLAPGGVAGAPSAADLFVRHHGNIRDALRELYDVCAAARRPA